MAHANMTEIIDYRWIDEVKQKKEKKKKKKKKCKATVKSVGGA